MSKHKRDKEVETYRGFTIFQEKDKIYYVVVSGCTLSFCSIAAAEAQIDSILNGGAICL